MYLLSKFDERCYFYLENSGASDEEPLVNKALSSPKAKSLGELVQEKQNFLDVLHPGWEKLRAYSAK
jgi:hypothetical protein